MRAGRQRPMALDESPRVRRRTRLRGSRHVGAIAFVTTVTAILAMGVLIERAGAVFTGTTQNVANDFTSAACFYRATVQSGSTTSTANGIKTVTITSVNTTKAFLLFSTRHDLGEWCETGVVGGIVLVWGGF